MRGLVLAALLVACGQNSDEPERRTLDLPGDANGIAWDGSALYVTDTTHGQVARWQDGGAFAPIGHSVGQLSLGGVIVVGGDVIATSFGFGKEGSVRVFGDNGHAIAGLDPARRRIGIARAPDGVIYDVYFLSGHGHHGGLAQLDLDKGETDLVTDLAKPVGIAVTADTIYVSDAETNEIFAFKRDTLERRSIARLSGVDLLTLLPDGDLVTGGKTGSIYRVRPATGAVSTVASGFTQVRGLAYDAAGKRLFVVEHALNTDHHVYIIPFDAA